MNLKTALKNFLSTYYGADIYYDAGHGKDYAMVIRETGVHRTEGSRFRHFPSVNIYLRLPNDQRQAGETIMQNIWNALDVQGQVELDTGYTVRSECPTRPLCLGQDTSNNWAWTLNVDFSVPTNLAI